MPSSILALRRMPAVSMKRTGPSVGLDDGVDRVACGARHVVHDAAVVADQSVEQRRLADVGTTDDGDAEDALVASRHRRRSASSRLDSLGSAGASTISSSRSPVPRPCSALDRARITETERHELPDLRLVPLVVDLVDDQQHRPLEPRAADPATRSSSSVTPTDAVDDEHDDVGLTDGSFALRAHLVVERSPPGIHPPVSTTVKSRPFQLASTSLRSRVTPGRSSTIVDTLAHDAVDERRLADVRAPDDRDDAQGRRLVVMHRPSFERGSHGGPSVATISTGRGQVVGVVPSRNTSAGQAHVGQQVAVPFGLVGEHARDVLPHHQAGHADVAAEELVGHRQQPHVARGRGGRRAARGHARRTVPSGCRPARRTRGRSVTRPGATSRSRGARYPSAGAPSTHAKNPGRTPVTSSTAPWNSSSNVRAMPTPSSCIGKPS